MRAYQDMVFSTAARLSGDRAHAEDIAQQVFLKAYEDFDRIHRMAEAGKWLRTVARNLTLNHLSRYRKRWRFFSTLRVTAEDEEAPELQFPGPDNLLDELEQHERHARVEAALMRLPEHQRVPLVLYHFEAMSYQEIADLLKVSLAKVKTDILRGRTSLAETLTRPSTRSEDHG